MSALEDRLLSQIRLAGLPEPERELQIIPGRRFRFDFGWPEHHLLVEVQGGTWGRGAHSVGAGVARDCEKQALAVLQGWRCISATSDQVRTGKALSWIRQALRGAA